MRRDVTARRALAMNQRWSARLPDNPRPNAPALPAVSGAVATRVVVDVEHVVARVAAEVVRDEQTHVPRVIAIALRAPGSHALGYSRSIPNMSSQIPQSSMDAQFSVSSFDTRNDEN